MLWRGVAWRGGAYLVLALTCPLEQLLAALKVDAVDVGSVVVRVVVLSAFLAGMA